MTDRFKNALNSLNRMKKYSDSTTGKIFTQMFMAHLDAVKEALTLAVDHQVYIMQEEINRVKSEQLRKERDELAAYILEVDDSCRTLFGDDAHALAKKVTENGNA